MNRLLKLSALFEVPVGLALIAVPSVFVRLLLSAEISGASVVLGRVAGFALLALGVACWLASHDEKSRAARAVASAMAIYNFGAALIFVLTAVGDRHASLLLWAAAILHSVMTVVCVATLLARPAKSSTRD